jgi:streptogramin lyase
LINDDFESLVISPNGSVWFAISDATVLRFDGMSWTSFTMDNPQVKGLNTWEMSAGLNEDICLGGREGINCFDGQSWYTIYLDNGFEGDYLENGIAIAPDGTLWVGTNKGLSHFDGQKWTNYSDTDGLLLGFGLIILAVILFGAGSLWIRKRTKVEKERSGLREVPLIFNG